jgi:hypothetical protein
MIVICTDDFRDETGRLKNEKGHAYKCVFDETKKMYLIESESPLKLGTEINKNEFEKHFMIFLK